MLGKFHIDLAKKGYKANAKIAVHYGISYIKEAENIPQYMKEFLIEGLQDLINTEDPPHAFYLKWSNRGRRPTQKNMFRDIDIAKIALEYKFYEDTKNGLVKRVKPIPDLIVFEEVAKIVHQSEGSVKKAYSKYKDAF